MFRDWLQHQEEYEGRDQEAEMWEEFVQQWESDKALNRLAENFESHDHPDNVMHCPICDCHCEIDDDGTADCDSCVIRWTVVDTGTFKYLDAEGESRNYDGKTRFHFSDGSTMDAYTNYTIEEHRKLAKPYNEHYDYLKYLETTSDSRIKTYKEWLMTEMDWGAESFNAESFRDWADDELRTHGENVSFEKWSQEEFEDEPAHRHADGQLSFVRWAKDEMNEEHHKAESFRMEGDCSPENWDYEAHNWEMIQLPMVRGHVHAVGWANSMGIRSYHQVCRDCGLCTECNGVHDVNLFSQSAEEFCAECGCSKKNAESFSAETANGNQVFNSCWKCGSGQHLYQISRYPASPDEIAGVGGDPSQANEDWKSGRPVQR